MACVVMAYIALNSYGLYGYGGGLRAIGAAAVLLTMPRDTRPVVIDVEPVIYIYIYTLICNDVVST